MDTAEYTEITDNNQEIILIWEITLNGSFFVPKTIQS